MARNSILATTGVNRFLLKLEKEKSSRDGTKVRARYFCDSMEKLLPLLCIPHAFLFSFRPGVMKMSLGEKAKLNISSEYGYGTEGAGGVIPPNADLVFVVELLAIGEKQADIPEEGGCCIIL